MYTQMYTGAIRQHVGGIKYQELTKKNVESACYEQVQAKQQKTARRSSFGTVRMDWQTMVALHLAPS